jgi:predicted PurR-regulated permease PerM
VSALDGAVSGLIVFILSLMFGVPTNFTIPTIAIMFLFSLVPIFGPTIGALTVALVLSFNDLTAALIFLIAIVLYQQVEANYISPKIQSRRMDLSPLAILVAVTTGIYLFGIAGGVVSIPIAGSIKILIEEYLKRAKSNRKKSVKPFHKLLKRINEEDFA